MDQIIEQQHLTNWQNYISTIDSQVHNMWNFILYNQFNNQEIRKLDITNQMLNLMLDKSEEKIKELKKENENLKKKKDNGKRRHSDSDIIIPPKRKKVIKINYLNDEIKKYNIVKNNRNKKELKKELNEIFKNIENINDIIELEKLEKKYDYIDFSKFTKLYNLIPSLKEFDNIIGMDNVKDTIFKNICYFIHGLHNSKEMNHVMISGPPGVGKTTIAKIMGKIYLELGFLENDNFITASRSDLIAKYLGQTAIKTQEVIDRALGGVLFIDEVYSLGNDRKSDSYAKECIDTINLNMSRDEPWLLIVGGYKDDIYNCFMNYNKGLERRFTVKLEINGYTPEELFLIFKKMVEEDGWELNNNINENIIVENKELFKFFGGDMRKLFQKAKEQYSLRLMKESLSLKNKEKNILSLEDIQNGIKYFETNEEKDEMDDYLKYTMYS